MCTYSRAILLHKRNGEKGAQRDFYENVHSNLNNSSKLETFQVYAYMRIGNTLKYIYIIKYYSEIIWNE